MDRDLTPTDPPSSAAEGSSPAARRVLDDLCALLRREADSFRRSAGDRAALARLERLARALRGHLLALRVLHDASAAPPSRPEAAAEPAPPVPEVAGLGVERPPRDGATVAPGGAPSVARPDRPPPGPAPDGDGPPRFPPFRDQETGLHSREGFDAVASGELKRCGRHERAFSLLVLQLPARRGEPLRRAALTIRRNLRESDAAGRHVERTFVVALPETSVEGARLVSRRLVTALEAAGTWDEEGRIGIATHPMDGDTLLSLLDTARGQLAFSPRTVLFPPEAEV